jgi:hypothetical protein
VLLDFRARNFVLVRLYTARTGQPGKDTQGEPGYESQDRTGRDMTGRIGKAEQDRKNMTDKPGRRNRTDRVG